MIQQLISDEKFTNIQHAQAGLTRLFATAEKNRSFYRVMKNDEPVGVLVPGIVWESMVEDIEALSSPSFRSRIAQARKETKRIPLSEVKKHVSI